MEGVLDAVQASNASFILRMPDARVLSGRFIGRSIHGLARVLGRPLIVFGNGWLGTSGQLEGVEADGFLPSDGKLWILSPDDLPLSDEVAREMASRFASVVGTWPGDETDEEIEQALKELS